MKKTEYRPRTGSPDGSGKSNSQVNMEVASEDPTQSGQGLPDPICSAVLDWYRGPAQGGGGTAGGDLWNDGDTLLVVVDLRDGSSDASCVNVSCDEGSAYMTEQGTGDDIGWTFDDISWWAILNDKFPKQNNEMYNM